MNRTQGWNRRELLCLCGSGLLVSSLIGLAGCQSGTQRDATRAATGSERYTGTDDQLLDEIQRALFERARVFREENTTAVDDYAAFREVIEGRGGFVYAHWDGSAETEAKIKEDTKATIRCIPMDDDNVPGVDMITGEPSSRRVLFARAY